ncbi:Protein C24A3.1 [Aphelenchoides avenae]|nr:Protein C24A3.1 [Aphelenchus avenae]
MSAIKGAVDRHSSDLITMNNEVRNRPVVDPADYIRQQDASKNDILARLTHKGDTDKAQLTEEARRLNDKITLITTEVTKNMNDREQRLRDDLMNKYDSSVKSLFDARLEYENEVQKKNEDRYRAHAAQLEELRALLQNDRNKYKDRFQKVNEALAALEHHLELGNKKVDKILNAEIQSRKLHEKGLLAKVNDVEERLSKYLGNLTKAVDDVRAGKENVKMPTLDTDALRREMEAIAADKNKMSMEGLLKLEEKMGRIQHGLHRDRRELQSRVSDPVERDRYDRRVRNQVAKLDDIMDDVEQTHERVRDKVERQIPQDLNELSAKVDNLQRQLMHRIDQEEEERMRWHKAAYDHPVALVRLDQQKGVVPILLD